MNQQETIANKTTSTIMGYLTDHWVSRALEITVLGVVAYYSISETRKTAEMTRQMLAKYDAAISTYAKEKSEIVDETASAAAQKIKEKADAINKENVIEVLQSLKKSKKPTE